jgi:hypothetical protein
MKNIKKFATPMKPKKPGRLRTRTSSYRERWRGSLKLRHLRQVNEARVSSAVKYAAVLILAGLAREESLRWSRMRDRDGWVGTASGLLPGIRLPRKARSNGLKLLGDQGLVSLRHVPGRATRARTRSGGP